MKNSSGDRLNRFGKEAAKQHPPLYSYNDERTPGEKKKRRRFIFWWLFFGSILIVSSILMFPLNPSARKTFNKQNSAVASSQPKLRSSSNIATTSSLDALTLLEEEPVVQPSASIEIRPQSDQPDEIQMIITMETDEPSTADFLSEDSISQALAEAGANAEELTDDKNRELLFGKKEQLQEESPNDKKNISSSGSEVDVDQSLSDADSIYTPVFPAPPVLRAMERDRSNDPPIMVGSQRLERNPLTSDLNMDCSGFIFDTVTTPFVETGN